MGDSSKIRVKGCILGLDSDEPVNPTVTCHLPCQWRVNAPSHFNCSWVLFDYLSSKKEGLTLREIGNILKTTHETVRNTEASALKKLKEAIKSIDDFTDQDLGYLDSGIRYTSKKMTKKEEDMHKFLIDFFGENDEDQ